MDDKKICILLDTNTWRRNLLLRTAMGSAFLYTINSARHMLCLPEVVEEEIKKHTQIAALEAKQKIRRSFNDMQAVIGVHCPYNLPTEEEITQAILERFEGLDKLIIRVPFTLEQAKSALNRVNQNIPPSSTKKQQFKDAAIWEGILQIGQDYDVYFISNDGDFYEDNRKKLLSNVLMEEAESAGITVKVFQDLEACLNEIETDKPNINRDKLGEIIYLDKKGELERKFAPDNLKLADIQSCNIRPFITEKHDHLAVEYTIIINAINTDTNELNEDEPASVTIEGSCTFNTADQTVAKNGFSSIGSNWVDINGIGRVTNGVYLSATSLHIGRQPDVPFVTKIEME